MPGFEPPLPDANRHDSGADSGAEIERLRRHLERERAARREAEQIAERGLRAMYGQQRRTQLLERIATAANESGAISEVMRFALEQMCEFTGCAFGDVWMVETTEAGAVTRSGAIWHAAKDYPDDDFVEMLDIVELDPGVGLPGRILAAGEPVWIADLDQDDNFPRRERARRHGLRSAFGFPVIVRSDVVAVIELFSVRTAEPDGDLLRLATQIGLQLGIVVQRERALLHDASHDALTRLPNRVLFLDRLSQSVARLRRDPAARFAVLFIDLDQFKTINDSLGHLAGDELLVRVGTRLDAVVREEDTLSRPVAERFAASVPADTLARLGGDEFTILLTRLSHPADAVRVANRIQDAMRAPFRIAGQTIHTSASIGIAIGDSDGVTALDLLRNADLAMYRAKALGKARCELFDRELHRDAKRRLLLENDLRRALASGEFVLQYQPILSLRTRVLVGFEALLRWNRPGVGLVPPGDFIAVAEETGLIVPIGTWVLAEACRTARAWDDALPGAGPFSMSVNISARQFQQPDFVAEVAQVLIDTAFDPKRLRLELTESMTMGDAERAVRVLSELKAFGIQISVDDFGTGFSSLSYLHRLPVDVLKIDRSFVSDMDRNPQSRAIVETIINLARGLKMDVIAEGAEREEQVDHLRSLGCQFGQGFLFSRPLHAPAAKAALMEGVGRLQPSSARRSVRDEVAAATPP